jgi:16S rRNA (guanine1207-N2)-methyltransferase
LTHYFDNNPQTKSNRKIIDVKIKDIVLKFYTDNNVFSKNKLDFGTRTLIENIDLLKIKNRVLDLGCGYGPIGIYLSKTTTAKIDMTDVNNRALELAKSNASLNNTTLNIFYSDKYSNINEKYDFIITNPPIRIGKKDLYEILFEAKNYLKPKGELWLVIHKNQGAKSLIKDLQKEYQIDIITKNKGFYCLKCFF